MKRLRYAGSGPHAGIAVDLKFQPGQMVLLISSIQRLYLAHLFYRALTFEGEVGSKGGRGPQSQKVKGSWFFSIMNRLLKGTTGFRHRDPEPELL